MKTYMLLGMITGAIIGVILVAVLLKVTKTDGSSKCRYDERQELVRGKGYKYGFFTLLIYNIVYGAYTLVCEKSCVDTITAMFIGIIIGVLVYAIYSYWNDAYISLNENPKRVTIAFALIAVFNFVLSIAPIKEGKLIVDGVLTFRSVNLICGLMFVILFIAFAIKAVIVKNNEE